VRAILRFLVFLIVIAVAAIAVMNFYFPDQLAKLAMNAERGAAHLQRRETDIPGGLHIVYLEGGQGQPLILLHGFGADKDNWTRVSRFLTPHYHVYAPDLPGFGESSKPDTAGYSIADQVSYVAAFAAAVHIDHFDLGGNSMGGDIAASYAAAHPQQVHSLWLLAPGGVATSEPSDLVKIIQAGGANPLVARTPAQYQQLLNFVFVKPPFVPSAVLGVLARRAADNATLNDKIFVQLVNSAPLEPQVTGLTTPTLVVWGDHDRALSYTGAAVLTKLMPNAKSVIMPDIGHLPMIEVPSRTAADYIQFRESLEH
jgi:pimeloyl-ACP methyl ester carboxylesterase